MKKILLFGVVASMMTAMVSCEKGATYSAEDKAFGDSLATALGQYAAVNARNQFDRFEQMDSAAAAKLDKQSMMRGLRTVLKADTADLSYFMGLQMGLQLYGPITGITNQEKYPVDKDVVMRAFREVFMADSLDNPGEIYNNYQSLMTALRVKTDARRLAEIENSDIAKANKAAGQAYAKKMVDEEGYQKSESGLVYKIEEAGDETKVVPQDLVILNYTGKKVDGEVFDSTEGRQQFTMRANQFVPGFNEALTMLGKGGKMTVVIPAELAYGVEGGGPIGYNETLVFDIEVVDINPAQN